jgi:hypothetical protein
MSTYSLRAAEVIAEYDDTSYKMIDVTITADDGKFMTGALPYHVTARNASIITASDGITASDRITASDDPSTVESFMTYLSQNGKEIHAFFTTDAFAEMSGRVNFEFSYGVPIGTINNVDIHTILTPLPPFLADLGYPDADNDLLDTI